VSPAGALRAALRNTTAGSLSAFTMLVMNGAPSQPITAAAITAQLARAKKLLLFIVSSNFVFPPEGCRLMNSARRNAEKTWRNKKSRASEMKRGYSGSQIFAVTNDDKVRGEIFGSDP
jgi:hypothetical protein